MNSVLNARANLYSSNQPNAQTGHLRLVTHATISLLITSCIIGYAPPAAADQRSKTRQPPRRELANPTPDCVGSTSGGAPACPGTPSPTLTPAPATPSCTPTPRYTPAVPTRTPTPKPTITPIATVTRTPTNSCALLPTFAELWPPNHKFRTITFIDPDTGEVVTPDVRAIYQDEPTQVIGSGRFCPDAFVDEDGSVAVRAERSGARKVPANGRVYHIYYRLNRDNALCQGVAKLCVPHNRRPNLRCVDGGPSYSSTSCAVQTPRAKSLSTPEHNTQRRHHRVQMNSMRHQ